MPDDEGGNSNSKFLGGRRRDARRHRVAPERPSEVGTDGLIAEFERGPFAALVVQDFPAGAMALLERTTGQRPDPAVLAAWERIRAFVGYTGVEMTPHVAARAMWADPEDRREGATVPAPAPPRSTSSRASPATIRQRVRDLASGESGPPNPEDLGD